MADQRSEGRIETTYVMGRSGRDASTYARTLDVLVDFLQHSVPGDYWIRRRLWRLRDDDPRSPIDVVHEADWGVARVGASGVFRLASLTSDAEERDLDAIVLKSAGVERFDEHDEDAFRRAAEERTRAWLESRNR